MPTGYATLARSDGQSPAQFQHSTSPSPPPSPRLPNLRHSPLSAAFEDVAGDVYVDQPSSLQDNLKKKRVGHMLKSLTGSQHSRQSYDIIEDDDYEDITPRAPRDPSGAMYEAMESDSPIRTASISRHLPLHNPTPDLQSVQGAYVKNVERLEDSAERISLSGSLNEELERMKNELKRLDSLHRRSPDERDPRTQSTTSLSNSIVNPNALARAGVFNSHGYITSPVGSIQSRNRAGSQGQSRISRQSNLKPLPEPVQEGRPLDSGMVHLPPIHVAPPRSSSDSFRPSSMHGPINDRPGTSGSTDTYRQAQNLFNDFDGIHFATIEENDQGQRRVSLKAPPRARDSRAFSEAQPGEKMVYYPAPVPVMLNLPKRLSVQNWADRDKKKLEAFKDIQAENRRSGIWINGDSAVAMQDPNLNMRRPRPLSNLPPQLRASAYFDKPGQPANIKLKHGSAVITLDSILDAAAHAPVSAFTDHPIAGHLGDEVYGTAPNHKKKASKSSDEVKLKKRSSIGNLIKRQSSATLGKRMSRNPDNELELAEDDPERQAEHAIAPDDDEVEAQEGSEEDGDAHEQDEKDKDEDEDEDEEYHQGFLGAPTTLLAELQMRKAAQKTRNRTAANAFPNGMHATLLEMDAVAQLQQKSRKLKHVALAWEDQDAAHKQNFDDEDVPLGMLFPEKAEQNRVNLNRPLGLMEKKELEENEPLSARRARLRGEPFQPRSVMDSNFSASRIHLAGTDMLGEELEEVEEETLGQRRARIAAEKAKRDAESKQDPANDVAEQLNVDSATISAGQAAPPPEQEETLGQRRKRLQAEREAAAARDDAGEGPSTATSSRPPLKQKTSMGDLLRANPVGHREEVRHVSNESGRQPLVNHINASRPNLSTYSSYQNFAQPALSTSNLGMSAGVPPPYFPAQPLMGYGLQSGQHNHFVSSRPMLQIPGTIYGQQNPNMSSLYTAPYSQPQPNHPSIMPMYTQQDPNASLGAATGMYAGLGNYQPVYNHMQMNVPGYPAGYDAIGMGPPLDRRQRAQIDAWRQSVA